ncbi:hypothetical protein [Bacteroides thetaiotaomicron]
MKKTNNQLDRILARILIILQIAQLLAESVWSLLLSIANYLAN